VGDADLGQTIKLLHEDKFMQIFASFSNWRVDSFIRQIEAEKKKGRVLPFVRGLRLSAQLVYCLRELLSGSGLTANWGHLLDSKGNFCSCECDVIIHKNGHIGRWDGDEHPVMDFKFISQEKAIAVISCKSYLKASYVDKQYCESIKEFVDRVWLFAECCDPNSIERIRNKAEECGYDKFWPLYTWNKTIQPTPYKAGWNDFVEEVERLKEKFGR
jgi:hypothetical protein